MMLFPDACCCPCSGSTRGVRPSAHRPEYDSELWTFRTRRHILGVRCGLGSNLNLGRQTSLRAGSLAILNVKFET